MIKKDRNYKKVFNELLEGKLDYTTVMYLDEASLLETKYRNKINSELASKIRDIIGELKLLFVECGYVDEKFNSKDLCDRVKICLDGCNDLEKIKKIKGLYQEFLVYRNKMADNNLDLVLNTVRGYVSAGNFDIDELIQWGNIGLLKAIERYDPSKARYFTMYAFRWINRYIINDAFKCSYKFSIPTYVSVNCYKMKNAIDSLSLELGRLPSDEELRDYMRIPKHRVEELRKFLEYGDDSFSIDLISSENSDVYTLMEQEDMEESVNKLFKYFTDNQTYVMSKLYGFEDGVVYSRRQLGIMNGITQQAIRSTEDYALDKLRKKKAVKRLKVYIED